MKTIAIIATSLILFSASFSIASAPRNTITVIDSFGRMLSMPVKAEEALDEFPFDQTELTNNFGKEQSSMIFDICELSKPEVPEEIPTELKALFFE